MPRKERNDMDCSSCGYSNEGDARFCVSCGEFLAKEEGSESTVIGLNQNIASLLSYVLVFVTGLVFFLLGKNNDYVRFHAMQSIVTFVALAVIIIALRILALIPYIGIIFTVLMWMVVAVGFICWLLLMVKAYLGKRFLLPQFGELAERETYGRWRG
jgi:uncharacterized membrane protein